MNTPEFNRRMRGVILELVQQNHEKQHSRFDNTTLAGVMARLAHDVAPDDVRTLLQDLQDRGMLTFKTIRDRESGKGFMRQIQITPKGRDILEGTQTDPAVDVE